MRKGSRSYFDGLNLILLPVQVIKDLIGAAEYESKYTKVEAKVLYRLNQVPLVILAMGFLKVLSHHDIRQCICSSLSMVKHVYSLTIDSLVDTKQALDEIGPITRFINFSPEPVDGLRQGTLLTHSDRCGLTIVIV